MFLLGVLTLCNIAGDADELHEFTRRSQNRMANCVDPTNRTLRQNDSENYIVITFIHDVPFERVFPVKPVFGVDAFEAFCPGRRSLRGIETKNAIPLIGEVYRLTIRHIPNPAAGV